MSDAIPIQHRADVAEYEKLALDLQHACRAVRLGLAGALTAARSMRGLLFGIEPWIRCPKP